MRKAIPKSLLRTLTALKVIIEGEKALIPEEKILLELFAQTVIKNVKFLLGPAEVAQCIAGNAFQSTEKTARLAEIATAGQETGISLPVAGSHFLRAGKNMLKF